VSGLVAVESEPREYKSAYVLNDEEIGLFSDEVVVNCASFGLVLLKG